MIARNAINAPKEISTSARLKLIAKKIGDGIQSITCPKKNLSRKFDKAPPAIIESPNRVRKFILLPGANRQTQIKTAQETPEQIKIIPGELDKMLKAAPVLYVKLTKSLNKILATCSIKTQEIIVSNANL